MKMQTKSPYPRVLTALLLAVFLFSLGFAGIATDTVLVASADELTAALSDAAASGNTTIIRYAAGTSAIELSGSAAIPSNVTLDLSTGGGDRKSTRLNSSHRT